MNKQHTPGPWAVYVNAHSDIVIRKMSKDGFELCAIARVSGGYANARLITAAPELLEACERLLAWDYFHEAGGRVQEDAEFARAAIEKATGENT